MLILLDHGTPRSLARFLDGHTVVEAITRGWDSLANGALLKAAEDAQFDLLLSTDKNIQYQQNLKGRKIAIIILGNCKRPLAAMRNGHPIRVGETLAAESMGLRDTQAQILYRRKEHWNSSCT